MPGVVTFMDDPVEIGITPLAHAKLPAPTAFNEILVWVQFKMVDPAALMLLKVGKAFTATVIVVGNAQSPMLGV